MQEQGKPHPDDVPDRLNIESQLREALTLQQAILDCAASSIIATDPYGKVITFNRAAERLLGYRAEEVIGKHTPLVWHDSHEMQRRAMQLSSELRRRISAGFEVFTAKAAAGEPDTNQWTYIHRHGARRKVELTVTALRAPTGAITGYLGVATDITDRQNADEQLRAGEERIRLATQFAGIGIWDWDVRANRTTWDEQMFAMYGLPVVNPVPYELWRQTALEEDLPAVETALRQVVEFGETQSYSFRARRGDTQELRQYRGACGPIFNEQGRVARVVGINFDVTDAMRLEEQFRKAQKMEAVGRLAEGVAHDFNNILTVIANYGGLLRHVLSNDEQLASHCDALLQATDRAAQLTRQLLAYSRKQAIDPTTVDANLVIRQASTMLRSLAGPTHELKLELAQDPLPIRIDPGQFEQVLMNLVLNACDAMTDPGQVVITTRFAKKDAKEMVVRVSDQGHGIPESLRHQIFEPFFTTKDRGKGMGLGLAVVQGIVLQAGGHIDVESKLDEGTTIQVVLPIVRTGEGRFDPSAFAQP